MSSDNLDNRLGIQDSNSISRRGFLAAAGVCLASAFAASIGIIGIPIPAEAAAPPSQEGKKLDERVTDYNVSVSYVNTTGGINDRNLPEGAAEIPPLEPVANGLTPVPENYTSLIVHWGPTSKEGNGRYLGFYTMPLGSLSNAVNDIASKNTKREAGDTDDAYNSKVHAKVRELANNTEFMAELKQKLAPHVLESIRQSFGSDPTTRVVYPNLGGETLDNAAYEMPSATYEFGVSNGSLKNASLALKLIAGGGPEHPGAEVGIYLEKVGAPDFKVDPIRLEVTNTGSAPPQTLCLPNLEAGTYRLTVRQLPSAKYGSTLLLEELGITGKLHEPSGKKRVH